MIDSERCSLLGRIFVAREKGKDTFLKNVFIKNVLRVKY